MKLFLFLVVILNILFQLPSNFCVNEDSETSEAETFVEAIEEHFPFDQLLVVILALEQNQELEQAHQNPNFYIVSRRKRLIDKMTPFMPLSLMTLAIARDIFPFANFQLVYSVLLFSWFLLISCTIIYEILNWIRQ